MIIFPQCVSPLKALIIIDVQNDFISGTLRLDRCPAKEHAEEIVPVINRLIGSGFFDVLAYTYDWHPSDHCSYLSNVKHHAASVDSSVNIEELKLLDVVSMIKPVELKQTMWPDHCLQNSWGAELHNDLRVCSFCCKFVYCRVITVYIVRECRRMIMPLCQYAVNTAQIMARFYLTKILCNPENLRKMCPFDSVLTIMQRWF